MQNVEKKKLMKLYIKQEFVEKKDRKTDQVSWEISVNSRYLNSELSFVTLTAFKCCAFKLIVTKLTLRIIREKCEGLDHRTRI